MLCNFAPSHALTPFRRCWGVDIANAFTIPVTCVVTGPVALCWVLKNFFVEMRCLMVWLILVDIWNPLTLGSNVEHLNSVSQDSFHQVVSSLFLKDRNNLASIIQRHELPKNLRCDHLFSPSQLNAVFDADDICQCTSSKPLYKGLVIESRLNLRGGGKKSRSKSFKDDTKLQRERRNTDSDEVQSEIKQKSIVTTRGSKDRSTILSELVAGMETEDHSKAKLSIQRVEQLRRALAKRDQTAVSNALEKVSILLLARTKSAETLTHSYVASPNRSPSQLVRSLRRPSGR
jgi:hypothetical protein